MEHILFNILSPFITFTYPDNWIYTFVLWPQTSEMLWASLPTRPQIPRFSLFPFTCVCKLDNSYYIKHCLSPCQSWGEGTLESLKSTISWITNVISIHNQRLVTQLNPPQGGWKDLVSTDDVLFSCFTDRNLGHVVTRATESDFKHRQFRSSTCFFFFFLLLTTMLHKSPGNLKKSWVLLWTCAKCVVRVQVDLIQFSRIQENHTNNWE